MRPELDRTFLNKLRHLYGCGIDVPCPRCGYNLRGLAAAAGRVLRCPECGRAVGQLLREADTHPERVRAMIRLRRRQTMWRAAKRIAAVAVTAAIASFTWLILR